MLVVATFEDQHSRTAKAMDCVHGEGVRRSLVAPQQLCAAVLLRTQAINAHHGRPDYLQQILARPCLGHPRRGHRVHHLRLASDGGEVSLVCRGPFSVLYAEGRSAWLFDSALPLDIRSLALFALSCHRLRWCNIGRLRSTLPHHAEAHARTSGILARLPLWTRVASPRTRQQLPTSRPPLKSKG